MSLSLAPLSSSRPCTRLLSTRCGSFARSAEHRLPTSALITYPSSPATLGGASVRTGICRTSREASVVCRAADDVLELSEDSVEQALQDARVELMQLFDESVGMTGTVELAELDGPFVRLRLQGRFWHKRADVLARVAAYLQRRIPDILEIDIEDEAQLDDSEASF